jgi:hypothetical protein
MHTLGMAQGWSLLASAVLILAAAFAVVWLYRVRAAKRFKNALNVYALREMADSAPLKGPKQKRAFATR